MSHTKLSDEERKRRASESSKRSKAKKPELVKATHDKWVAANREATRKIALKWQKANLPKVNEASKTYQRTKLEKLAGRPKPTSCEVCGSTHKISFDHDHATGKFRGWLCHGCNIALGYVKDSPDTLRKLARYLDRHNKKQK